MFGSNAEPPLTSEQKIKFFLVLHWRGVLCILAPVVCIGLLLPFPPKDHQVTAYCVAVMAIYWISECIPLAVTSFLPLIIFPLSGVLGTTEVAECYMNDTIFMFIGSLIMAYSVEQSGLHKRLAYIAIRSIGYSHIRLLIATCSVTTFVSMWITNTAAATMMVPIYFAVLKVFEDQKLLKIYETTSEGNLVASDITVCYFCAATYSATIGGIGTLVGTDTNLVFKGLFTKQYPDAPEFLSFPMFSAFCIPFMIMLETCMLLCMLTIYLGFLRPGSETAKRCKVSPEGMKAAEQVVETAYKELGRLTYWEFMVIILFGTAMAGFFSRSPQIFKGWGDMIASYFNLPIKTFAKDSAMAFLITYLMFLLPSNLSIFKNCTAKYHEDLPAKSIRSILDWKTLINAMPYSFTFLLGGGFALSSAANKTGLNKKIGEFLQRLKGLPNALVLLFVITFGVLVTNVTSNVAVCNLISPICMQLGKEIGVNPLWYVTASGLASSFCFLLPIGTPGNLIVQGAAKIPTAKMIKAGIGPTITTICISWFTLYFYAPVIWPVLHEFPDWIH